MAELEGIGVLRELMEGNRRFRQGESRHRTYTESDLKELAQAQHPVAAVIACADSRVSPDIVFDQPLGRLFASRVPGNVASDSAKWMVDIAVGEFKVPLLIVMAHTGCLAVGQVVRGETGGPGGPLRLEVLRAFYRAQHATDQDLWHATTIENAKQTIAHLQAESNALRTALLENRIVCMPLLYEMETGRVVEI
jgi:carbonic anhydrase